MSESTSSQVEFGNLDQLVDRLKSTVQSAFEKGTPIDQLEQDLLSQLLSMGRALLGSLFASMKEGDVGPTLERDDKTLRRLPQLFHRTYYSVFGKFDILRCGYGTRVGQKLQAIPFDEHLAVTLEGAPHPLCPQFWIAETLSRIRDIRSGSVKGY